MLFDDSVKGSERFVTDFWLANVVEVCYLKKVVCLDRSFVPPV